MLLRKMLFIHRCSYIQLFLICCLLVLLPQYGVAEPCDGYSVVLTEVGSSKIQAIKAVRELTGLGLRQAKEVVESAPITVRANLPLEEAVRYRQRLEEAGARVQVECSTGSNEHPAPPPPPVDSRPPLVNIKTDTILVKTVGDRIRVHVRAEDNDKVASIIIYAEGQAVKTCSAWECWYGEQVMQAGLRRYHAEAFDRAGNRGISTTLKFMVHPTAKPGPSLNIRTNPYHPTSSDRVRFIASGAHSSGVRDISFHIAGVPVRTCRSNTCEYIGGPYPAGNITWRVSARSLDGGETYGSENHLLIKAAPSSGQCSISGKATGPNAAVARAFFINLYGPNNMQLYRKTASFQSNGQYHFDNLPDGRYKLLADTRGDIAVGVHPATRIVECRGAGSRNVNFEFR